LVCKGFFIERCCPHYLHRCYPEGPSVKQAVLQASDERLNASTLLPRAAIHTWSERSISMSHPWRAALNSLSKQARPTM
jgi:hypothetical protein